MRSLFNRLGRQAIVYGLGGSALPLVGLITLPVYTHVFGPTQYGRLEVAAVGFTALLVLVDSGMTTSAQRSFYDYSDSHVAERRNALLTSLTVVMTLATATAVTLILFSRPISRAVFASTTQADLIRIVGWTVPVATLAAFLREVMRLRFRAWHYVGSATLGAIGAGATGVVAVTVFGAGIYGYLLGLLVGNAAAALYGLVVSGPDLIGRFSVLELRRMARYGGPLIPATFALWGLAFLDRIMLSKLGNFYETGQYSVGSRFATVLMFGFATFMTAYLPFMFSLWQEDAGIERQMRARVLFYVTFCVVSLGLVMSLFAREVIPIFAPRFDRAYLVVGVLSTGVALYAVATICSSGIGLARRTVYIGAYTVLATGVNVGLNFLLIPSWGMLGAATATTGAYGLLAALYYRKAQQISHTPYMVRRTLSVLLVGCPLMAVGALPIEPDQLAIAIKLLTLGLFALAIWQLRLLDDDELNVLLSMTRRLRSRVSALSSPS
jgi:O-antigen/teichoic acid export membrane protein